ncbi:MAG: tetratricopeptide repeat protein [Desulfobacterales bacterium]|nr:tetratricopeptide repeat protein [Desulfobacterales bacterium]MCP4159953.1 tetratricopeptide repeat protein [Deltaproteobacteria bacterium]
MQESILYKEKTSTKEFLVSKSENKVFEVPDDCIDTSFLNVKFPDLLSGDGILLKWSEFTSCLEKFSVISVHTDSMPDSEICQQVLADIATIVNDICADRSGFWGLLEKNTFTLTIPDKNNAKAIKIAKKIRGDLSKIRPETVSIGIAHYPELSFEKDVIINNSVKALEHSYFFEGNSIVSFDAVSLNISGDKFYLEGKIDLAIKEFENAIKISPNNVNVRNSLGICYGIQNRAEDALEEFEEAINLDPNEVMAIHNAGLICSMVGDSSNALSYFLKADSFEHNLYEVKFHLGKHYFEENDIDKAADYLNSASQIKESSLAYYYIAECQFAKGSFKKAVKSCKKAVKLSPNNGQALSLLSELFFQIEENIDITITFARHSVAIEPDNGLFRKRLGKLLYVNKDNDEALEEFETASSLGEDVSEYIDELRLKSA